MDSVCVCVFTGWLEHSDIIGYLFTLLFLNDFKGYVSPNGEAAFF